MPRDAVSRTANVERTGRHKWVNRDDELNKFAFNISVLLASYFHINYYLTSYKIQCAEIGDIYFLKNIEYFIRLVYLT